MTDLPLSREQIAAIQARAEKEWGFAARNIPALCQQALRAIELEADKASLEELLLHARTDAVENLEACQKLETKLRKTEKLYEEYKSDAMRCALELTATRNALDEATADACDEEIVAAITEEPMATRTPSRIVHYLKKHGLKIVRALPSPEVKP